MIRAPRTLFDIEDGHMLRGAARHLTVMWECWTDSEPGKAPPLLPRAQMSGVSSGDPAVDPMACPCGAERHPIQAHHQPRIHPRQTGGVADMTDDLPNTYRIREAWLEALADSPGVLWVWGEMLTRICDSPEVGG